MRKTLLLLLLCNACRDGGTQHLPPPPPGPECGDGILDASEECEGSQLGGATCVSLGYDSGELSCDGTCHYAKGLCVKKCGNGVLDLGEPCDGPLGLTACATWGYPSCSATCTVETLHCVAQAFEAAPSLLMTKGGPGNLGDTPPAGPGDLVMAVPSFGRVELVPWTQAQGFDGTLSRKLSFQRTPVRAWPADLSGDGNQDVVALNADGTMDVMIYNGSGFTPSSFGDAGCPGGDFVGTGHFASGAALGVLVAGCTDAAWVLGTDARRLSTPGAVAFALGDVTGDGLTDILSVDSSGAVQLWAAPDFSADGGSSLTVTPTGLAAGDLDGDGDLDLVATTATGVVLYENTGLGFAEKQTFAATAPFAVKVVDLDLDGKPDVFFATGTEVVVRRNRGGWTFTEVRQPGGTGTWLSVSVGDADGDGDPDIAVTVATGVDSTQTNVLRNRVR